MVAVEVLVVEVEILIGEIEVEVLVVVVEVGGEVEAAPAVEFDVFTS